jgi:hypothetical protein
MSTHWRIASDGVPQGSILVLLLFLLYINHLTLTIQPCATPVLFADDTCIIIKNNNRNDFLKNCREIFTRLNIWFINDLFLNYEKTNFLQCRTKNSSGLGVNLKFNNKTVDNKNQTKLLGIILDSSLKWSEQMN